MGVLSRKTKEGFREEPQKPLPSHPQGCAGSTVVLGSANSGRIWKMHLSCTGAATSYLLFMTECELFHKGKNTFTAAEMQQCVCPRWHRVGYAVFIKLNS